MMSKISFSKMVRDEMRKLNWLTAVQLLVFGLLIPFRVLMVMSVTTSHNQHVSAQELAEVFCQNVGFGHIENTLFILAAGGLCALCAFGYVHSQVKLDFFHSLAVKRERLFGARYLGSVLTFVIAYGVSQLLALLLGVFYQAASARVALEMVVASLQGLLCFLCSYAGVLLAVMLTGKMLTTFLALGVLGGYIPLLWLIRLMCTEVFFQTSLNSFYLDRDIEILKCSSPWAFCLTQQQADTLVKGVTGRWPGMAALCQLVAVAAIFSVISLLLYRVRRTEAAGNALAFVRTEGIVKLLLTVPAALIAGSVANELFESPVWELGFIVLFGALACIIMEFIYRGDIRQVLGNKRHIAVTVLTAAAVFFFCRYDVPGYNTWLPGREEVAGMAVQDDMFGFSYGTETEQKGYRYVFSREVLDLLETDAVDPIYAIAENGVKHQKSEYDTYNGGAVYVGIKYHLVSGKEVYRSYWVERGLYLDCMNELMENDSFREKYFPINDWKDTNSCYAADAYIPGAWVEDVRQETVKAEPDKTEAGVNTALAEDTSDDGESEEYGVEYSDEYETDVVRIEIPSQEIRKVIEAYQADLAERSYEELFEAEGTLLFHYLDISSDNYPISQTFTRTIALLRQYYPEYGSGTNG